VEDGLKLTKRLVMPNGGPAPCPHTAMDRGEPLAPGETQLLLPTAPMAYAVVVDPGTVDSPDVLSYQPHVYGGLDPPALIPLQMRKVDLCVDAAVTRAQVTLRARWWVSPSVHGGGCTTSREVEPVTAASSCPWDTRSCPALCPPYFCFRAISIHFSSLLLHFSVLLPVSYWIWPRLGVGMVGTDRVAAAPGNMISVRWLGLGPHEFSVHYRPLWTAQIRTYYIRVIMQLLHSCIRLENQ
jgi:hypothetical protein